MPDESYKTEVEIDTNTAEINEAAEATNRFGNEIENLGKKTNRANGFLNQLHSRLFGQLAAASLAARAIRYVGRELKEFAEFDLNAPVFKENTELAYATVLKSAEKGKRTFETLDDIAREVHLPSEKAHDIATHLMEQGLHDTLRVSQVIEASAALIRTGNEKGAEKLMSIIDRSIAVGHFGTGGKGGGRAARQFAGLGISATLAHELASGKVTVEDGIKKIYDAIEGGDIGKVAKARFDLKDFGADVSNTFRRVAQNTDLHGFDASLRGLDESITKLGQDGGLLNTVFQGAADAFGWAASRAAEFTTGIEHLAEGLRDAFKADHDFTDGMAELPGAFATVLGWVGRFSAAFVTGVVEVFQTAATTAEELGAALGFLGDAISHPTHIVEKYKAYHKTVQDMHDGLMASLKKEDKLIGDFLAGDYKNADPEKVTRHFYREGKALDFVADAAGKAKRAMDEILGPEDLVFSSFFGELDVGARVIEAGHRGPGFANLFGAGLDPNEYYGEQTPRERLFRAKQETGGAYAGVSASDLAARATAGGGGAPTPTVSGMVGGKSVSLTWTGNVYVGSGGSGTETHGGTEDAHFRDLMDSALIDAFDRLRLELGA
jgi:hypothetical protein